MTLPIRLDGKTRTVPLLVAILSTGCADVLGIDSLMVAESGVSDVVGGEAAADASAEMVVEATETATEDSTEARADITMEAQADTREEDAIEAEAAHPTCPAKVPSHAQDCVGGEECVFDECREPKSVFYYAQCVGQSWQVVRFQCQAVSCGSGICAAPGEVCMEHESGDHHCRPNPCRSADMEVSCACAAQMCSEAYPICDNSGTSAFHVLCVAF